MTTANYLGSLLGPYAGMLPGATTSDILSSPIGGDSTDGSTLSMLQQLLQGKGNQNGGNQKQNKNNGGGGGGGGNTSLRRLPDSVNNSVNENRRIAKALIARRYPKWDHEDYKNLVHLWNGESGWQAGPSSDNPTSSAYGIPQALTSLHKLPKDYMHSPIAQEQWGLKYIAGKYGDPTKAWHEWLSRSPHWY